MLRYRVELAGPDDDADLRRVLAETPMPGPISLAFCREPSFFEAAVVDGQFRHIVVVRDTSTGRVVGFGSRSIRNVYVNGIPSVVGYLGNLRLLTEHRKRGLVPRGYAFFRRLHSDERAPMYLTTIADGNRKALELLTSGRAGLPAYHRAGALHTVALTRGQRGGPRKSPGITVRMAAATDLSVLLAFLHAEGPRRQFFPIYKETDFFTPNRLLRGLRPEDVLLAFRDDQLVGTLGAWDQRAFRQTIVHGYAGMTRWLRPVYNLGARICGRPRLPRPGLPLPCLLAALPVVRDDDPEVFAALLDEWLRRAEGGPWELPLIGLCGDDPLLPTLGRYSGKCYTTQVFHVCWEDGEVFRQALDRRPTYLELGSL